MKKAIAALVLSSFVLPGIAYADAEDEYVACVIGHAAVALKNMQKKDSNEAQAIAYKKCKTPRGIEGDEVEGVSDFINLQVMKLADEQ